MIRSILLILLMIGCNRSVVKESDRNQYEPIDKVLTLTIDFDRQEIVSTDSVSMTYILTNISSSEVTVCFDISRNGYMLENPEKAVYEETHETRSHGGCWENEVITIPFRSGLSWTNTKKFSDLESGTYFYTAKIRSWSYSEGILRSAPVKFKVL